MLSQSNSVKGQVLLVGNQLGSIVTVEYGDIQWMAADAARDDVHLYELKTPIQWFEGFHGPFTAGCIGLLIPNKRVRGWYVRPEYRGIGMGVDLLRHVIGWGRDLGFDRLEIRTLHRGLCESEGFIATGREYPTFKLGVGYQLYYEY